MRWTIEPTGGTNSWVGAIGAWCFPKSGDPRPQLGAVLGISVIGFLYWPAVFGRGKGWFGCAGGLAQSPRAEMSKEVAGEDEGVTLSECITEEGYLNQSACPSPNGKPGGRVMGVDL